MDNFEKQKLYTILNNAFPEDKKSEQDRVMLCGCNETSITGQICPHGVENPYYVNVEMALYTGRSIRYQPVNTVKDRFLDYIERFQGKRNTRLSEDFHFFMENNRPLSFLHTSQLIKKFGKVAYNKDRNYIYRKYSNKKVVLPSFSNSLVASIMSDFDQLYKIYNILYPNSRTFIHYKCILKDLLDYKYNIYIGIEFFSYSKGPFYTKRDTKLITEVVSELGWDFHPFFVKK